MRPQIDAYRATSRQHLCGGNEQKPVATTDIEHGFVSAKLQAREEAVARAKFTEATAGEHERREDQTAKGQEFEPYRPGRGAGSKSMTRRKPTIAPARPTMNIA